MSGVSRGRCRPAGGLLAAATVSIVERRTGRPATPGYGRAAMILGVIAAELPDADLLYAGPVLGMGKLGYLLHHRGHTHTVVFAVAAALLLWGVALRRRHGARPPAERRGLLGLALAVRAWSWSLPAARKRTRVAALALLVTAFPLNTSLAFYSTFWGGVFLLLLALYGGALFALQDDAAPAGAPGA